MRVDVTAQHASALRGQLRATVGVRRVHERARAAALTTLGVGGPVEWLVDAPAGAVPKILSIAASTGTPVTFLGGGSNVLVGDRGIRGIVVRIRGGEIRVLGPERVRADAGVTVNALVRWTISRGLSGLAAWAGTPGTIGGAIAGNAHFHGRLIGELVDRVGVAGRTGESLELSAREMEFAYDHSRVRRTNEIVLWVVFRVEPGHPEELRTVARASLTYRKQTQPLSVPSAGCVFQNPEPERDRLPPDVPASAGALVDRVGLKGYRVGAARISETHGNFIVNEGGATARDILVLIDACKRAVAEQFNIVLREEIVRLGDF